MAKEAPNPPEIIDVVLAAIVRDGRVLIAQRRMQDPFGGLWELPGGKRLPNEPIDDCLQREIREELGVAISAIHEFHPITHAYRGKTVRLLAFACRLAPPSADPRPLAADRLAWAAPAELPSFSFPAANDRLIEQISAYLAHGG